VIDADSATLSALGGSPPVAERIRTVADCLHHMLRHRLEARPVLGNMRDLVAYLTLSVSFRPFEQVRAIYLNAKLRLIRDEVVSLGCVSEAPVFVRPILKRALDLGASGVILAHNHPSGDPTPSDADLEATRALSRAAAALDLKLLDHIILARGEWTSLRARGLL
jgi:DNA repair protein RadC